MTVTAKKKATVKSAAQESKATKEKAPKASATPKATKEKAPEVPYYLTEGKGALTLKQGDKVVASGKNFAGLLASLELQGRDQDKAIRACLLDYTDSEIKGNGAIPDTRKEKAEKPKAESAPEPKAPKAKGKRVSASSITVEVKGKRKFSAIPTDKNKLAQWYKANLPELDFEKGLVCGECADCTECPDRLKDQGVCALQARYIADHAPDEETKIDMQWFKRMGKLRRAEKKRAELIAELAKLDKQLAE